MPRERLLKLIERSQELFTPQISPIGERNYKPELQLLELGLEDDDIKRMVSKRILDVGSGLGFLVEYLRAKRVNAEGIDIDSPKFHYFMKQHITELYPKQGSIPRSNNCYDIILSHGLKQNILIPIVLAESLRTLKINGEMIISPSFYVTEEFLSRVKKGKYLLEKRDVWFWQESEKYFDEIGRSHCDYEPVKYTTVIKKLA